MGAFTALASAIVEAWAELRVNRTRVLLSLIGVSISVAALTGVAALGDLAEQAQQENLDRASGRPAMLQVNAYNPESGSTPDPAVIWSSVRSAADRYGIGHASRVANQSAVIRLSTGDVQVGLTGIDPAYGSMHRVRLTEGSWFTDRDAARFAPAVIIDSATWELLGSPDLRSHPTVVFPGAPDVTGVVIGVAPSQCEQCFQVTALYEDLTTILPGVDPAESGPWVEAWVPEAESEALGARIASDLRASLGPGWQVDATRTDWRAFQTDDPFLVLKVAIGAIAGFVLLLGALGLVNISLVTVRYRIREIGIRRSFGATAGRVFFGVMLESVVATVVAGGIGVGLAILALKNPWVADLLSGGLDDVPPFPVTAALIGLGSAALVGALAGLLPALVAVRVKPIEAIRY